NSKNPADIGYDSNDAEVLMRRTASAGTGTSLYASHMTVVTTERTGGYFAEIQVGWEAFPFSPANDVEFGFDVKVGNDTDGGDTTEEVLALFDNIGDSWGNPSSFGTAVLAGEVSAPEE